MKVTFTGHRPDKIQDPVATKDKLLKCLKKTLNNLNDHTYIVGGCPGFDTIALELLLEEKVPKEQILIAVPFKGFEKYAGRSHVKENSHAQKLNYSCGVQYKEVGEKTGSYGQKCFRRNLYMIQNSEIVFTNWDGTSGGTANTVKLAINKKIPVININEEEQ